MTRGAGSPDRRLARQADPRPAGERSRRIGQAVHASCRQRPWRKGSIDTQGLLALVKAIADTGFLVAFVNRNDRHHDWAFEVAEGVTEPLLTCEAVLAETAFHLESVAITLAMIEDGLIKLEFDCNAHLDQLAALAKRYAARKPDLADLCIVRMSELYPRHSVITVDRKDFRVYRRNKREAIPLICPPED